MLAFNDAHDLRYFRITSDLVPFASHPVCRFDWAGRFRAEFAGARPAGCGTGDFRITMHPDQFTLLNSPDRDSLPPQRGGTGIPRRTSWTPWAWTPTARIQIHVGGVYGDRAGSLRRFAERFRELPEAVRRRLTVENDERLYPLADCLALAAKPACRCSSTRSTTRSGTGASPARLPWRRPAGRGRQGTGRRWWTTAARSPAQRAGTHAESLDDGRFRAVPARVARRHDFDLMLEIKDKERSALRALALADGRS